MRARCAGGSPATVSTVLRRRKNVTGSLSRRPAIRRPRISTPFPAFRAGLAPASASRVLAPESTGGLSSPVRSGRSRFHSAWASRGALVSKLWEAAPGGGTLATAVPRPRVTRGGSPLTSLAFTASSTLPPTAGRGRASTRRTSSWTESA